MTCGLDRGGEGHDDDEQREVVVRMEGGDEQADLPKPMSGAAPAVGGAVAEVGEIGASKGGRWWQKATGEGRWGLGWILLKAGGGAVGKGWQVRRGG